MQECGTARWRMPVARWCLTGALCLLISAAVTSPATAQGHFFVEAAGDYSPVEIGTTEQTWGASRLSGGWLADGRAGWTLAVERQTRDRLSDWAAGASGFRRAGDWTFSGGVGAGHDPSFSYRRSFEGELGRRVVGTLVAQGAYRYLRFNAATVHLIQPGATLYLPHGDIGARYFIVSNSTRPATTGALQVQGNVSVTPRLRLGGGGAFGERIFDIASLQAPSADAWVGYGYAHITATPAWSFDIAVGRAHENPVFSQALLTLGVRRTFGVRR
jgi:YaiO family outer membrane protein